MFLCSLISHLEFTDFKSRALLCRWAAVERKKSLRDAESGGEERNQTNADDEK